MASSSWSAAAGEPQDEEVRIEPHEPPYGPPPPQNIFSLQLSQTIVDALAPQVVHRGAFLTRIQGRITDCVGITAVLRPMTPNEFLHDDVLHCADDNSELEDPEDTIVEEAANTAEAARDRARRASAEWLERRAEFEAMMAARSETTMEATVIGPDENLERGTGSASSSGNRVATPQPKTSRKQASHLLSFAVKSQHSTVPTLTTCSGELATLADKLRLSFSRCPHCLGDSRAFLFAHIGSLHIGRSLQPAQLRRKTVSEMLPLDARNEYSTFGCSSLLESSMLARYTINTSWTTMAGPSSHLLLVLLGIAVHVVVTICARCLQLCHTVLPGQVQNPACILNTAVLTSTNGLTGRNTSATSSRVGPKSDRVSCRPPALFTMLLWLCFCCYSVRAGDTDARVGAAPIAVPEATAKAVAKPNGMRKASEPPSSHTQVSSCTKRSFRRAFARSCRTGGALYKGRWRPMAWFAGSDLRPQKLPSLRPKVQALPHWRTLWWNSGGLTTSVFQELETWLLDQKLDVALIAETKWTFEATWSNQHYHYIHSPGSGPHDRVAGVLIIISTRLAKAEEIQFYAPHPGRLLHARIPHGSNHIDILAAYQYAINQQDGTFARRTKTADANPEDGGSPTSAQWSDPRR